jgi:type I restriction enzyme R subunit
MSTNFHFIDSKDAWKPVLEAAVDGEQHIYTKPVIAGILFRQSMELMVNWMYTIDLEFELPFRNTLAAKLRANCFVRDVPQHITRELEMIREIGNNATHKRLIRQEQAQAAAKYLHNFFKYITRTYTDQPFEGAFDESIIPHQASHEVGLAEKKEANSTFEAQKRLIEEQLAEIKANEQQLLVLQAERERLTALKKENKDIPQPVSSVSEAATRKLYIDVELEAVGWDLDGKHIKEFELDNMPTHMNRTGKGFVDYVLWGDDGLPLAVIEAKRTTKNPKDGKRQAVNYADALEAKYGRRPLIFYTNGFETWFWDDTFYPPRKVAGFFRKDELEALIERRISRKDLRNIPINKDIAGRYYQEEAMKRVAETWVGDFEGDLSGNKRKALLVMATGTGKTRTAIALVDMLLKANWVKRVLFMADRTELVKQARNSFNIHLPQLTSVNLTKEEDNEAHRLVFSTYPTMLNRIDEARSQGKPLYGVGHFDLIIVDEAHRSIYKKYEDIFLYFDALLLGLTATPHDETHRDTYHAFDCEVGNPTYYYELDQAVTDQYLVPPKKLSVPTTFLQRGIKYDELPEEDREQFENAFAMLGEEVPEEIDAAAINKWLFNKDTIRKILNTLMDKGIKIESGDKIGKTIIFAKNQDHAELIEDVFNEQFPQYRGVLTEVISYRNKHAETAIEKFKTPEQNPQIAVSVDMLDTGIDVPEIVNLVFFKPVYSKAKFWQMIGRGTRLCTDLLGEGRDKEHFFIFDCCLNFEFFEINPEGVSGFEQRSISHRLFEIQMQLAEALRGHQFLEDGYQAYRNQLLDNCHQMVLALYSKRSENFRVRQRLGLIEEFSNRDAWNDLGLSRVNELSLNIGKLVFLDDSDEKAKLFDYLMLRMQLAMATEDPGFGKMQQNVQKRAERLLTMSNIPAVRDKLSLLTSLMRDEYWSSIALPDLEHIRVELRHLMNLLKGGSQSKVHMDIEDIMDNPGQFEDILLPTTPENYLEKVRAYVEKNRDYLVISKLFKNQPITHHELEQLEEFLFDGDERGTREDFQKAFETEKPLGVFIRSILGLDRNAAMQEFSTFLEKGNLSSNQQKFIETIIDHFTNQGYIDPKMLFEAPYTHYDPNSVVGLFDNHTTAKIFSIIHRINGNAEGVG